MAEVPLPFRGEVGRAAGEVGRGADRPAQFQPASPSPRPSPLKGRGSSVWPALAVLLCLLALARPIDHDESQYVAAVALTAHGLLPYRDFAYLQTPLQPFLFAPLAWIAGAALWPALRLANALCGAAALVCTWRAARLVAPARTAGAAVGLLACCDAFLFSIGTARNDALPAACYAGALWLAIRAERGWGTRWSALGAGALLAAAAAAKISYALPAAAYAAWALARARGHRPGFVALGAAPVVLLVAAVAARAPAGFVFGVLTFPGIAPADYYADQAWKLTGWAKLGDLVKFLALGPALLAFALVLRRRMPAMLALLVLAGLAAALGPTPTWRQYLLPLLPPLFVMLAARRAAIPPSRAMRISAVVFAAAGLSPTIAALASGRPAMPAAWRDGRAIGAALDRAGATGPVATLSPEFLPATGRLPDPRFAAGPFFFRSRRLVVDERALHLLGRHALGAAPLSAAILVGGEGAWTSGDDRLDARLAAEAARRGYRATAVPGTRFRLWLR
ncbi:ArnT family glycosyltransferase [uncultured Sphingomonas sp.]|uniref:ArnT family glycosyltransferase n=1 Tax=uncultured Sphingomonas sp. TaxID=158754 RepID=UPI0035CA1B2E